MGNLAPISCDTTRTPEMRDSTPDEWARLKPLLDEMLELPSGVRTEWLARQRLLHPDLGAQLTDLAEREKRADAEGFLAGSPLGEMAPVSSLAGQVLGGYVLEREIGRGGMGSVWLAQRADGRFEGAAAIVAGAEQRQPDAAHHRDLDRAGRGHLRPAPFAGEAESRLVEPGDYTVSLGTGAAACSGRDPRTITVGRGQVVVANFALVCP